MGKPIVNEYGQDKGILKFFPYEGAVCVIPSNFAQAVTENGHKIVKAGTPYPSNDNKCLGYLLHTVDITQGSAPATYVYQGTIDTAKLTENGIEVQATAKSATPRVTFFG